MSDICRTSNRSLGAREVGARLVVDEPDAGRVGNAARTRGSDRVMASSSTRLISMPVTVGFRNASAVRMSRPPPTPMTPACPFRSRYASEATSYWTHSSDAGSPFHSVIGVPAMPSIDAQAMRAGTSGVLSEPPQRNTWLCTGRCTITFECAFQAE